MPVVNSLSAYGNPVNLVGNVKVEAGAGISLDVDLNHNSIIVNATGGAGALIKLDEVTIGADANFIELVGLATGSYRDLLVVARLYPTLITNMYYDFSLNGLATGYYYTRHTLNSALAHAAAWFANDNAFLLSSNILRPPPATIMLRGRIQANTNLAMVELNTVDAYGTEQDTFREDGRVSLAPATQVTSLRIACGGAGNYLLAGSYLGLWGLS